MEHNTLYPSLDTPAVLVDMDKLEANIREMSQLAAEAGVKLRVHIKVHESAAIANMQIEAGAYGIEVGPIGQAEAMAEEGFNDIIIAHPGFYGGPKGETLKKLLSKPGLKIALVLDMLEQAEGVSQVGQAVGRKVPVLIKIDLGKNSRYGVPPGEPLLALARKICQLSGVELIGIYAHEMGAGLTQEIADKTAFDAASVMAESANMLRREGIAIDHASVGSSSTFRFTCCYLRAGKFPEITECHPGNFVIGDIMYMKLLGNTREQCAATVLTTVMSTSRPDYAVIDAGYKTFGSDPLIAYRDIPGFWWQGKPSFGSIQGRPDLWFGRLSAETGCIYYKDNGKKLSLGERLEIVPNNVTLVINIHDKLYGIRGGVVEQVIPVTGRGRGN